MNNTYAIDALIKQIQTQLETVHISPQAEQEAWWLLQALTKKSNAELLACKQIDLTTEEKNTLDVWIGQRVQDKKPLQFIIGSVPFCDLDIIVKSPVLIPRPETEEWVDWVIKTFASLKNERLHILDLCTGTGCIALALAAHFKQATVVGVDIDQRAIDLANANKKHNNIENVSFLLSDLFAALNKTNSFDVIVSNPPYLSDQEYRKLEQEVTTWESAQAFVGGSTGLEIYKQIAAQASAHLKHKSILAQLHLPRIIVELGTKPEQVATIFAQNNFSNISLHKDMQIKYRWLTAECTYHV